MAQNSHSDGWTDMPSGGWEDMPTAPAQPGMAHRLLTWATTPFKAMEPILAEQKATAGSGLIGKDSPDALAGVGAFVSGLPGFQPSATSPEFDERMSRFRQEHPIAGTALPFAGGFAAPVLPTAGAAQPGAVESLANSLAARTLRGTATEYKTLGKEGVQSMGDMLLRRRAVRLGSSPKDVAARVAGLPEATGQELGGAISALDSTGGQVSKQALAQRFTDLANEARSGGPGAAPLVAKYENAAESVLKDIQATGEPMMSFKQAEQWKQAYQAPINYAKTTNTPLEMGSREVASAARQGVEDAASAAGPGTDLADAFLNAKKESGLAQQAAKMTEGAEGRRMGRNMSSPTARAMAIAGVATALASGHPGAVIPALTAGPALEQVLKRSPATLAVLLKATAPGAARTAAQGGAADLLAILRELRQNRSAAPALAQSE